MVASTYTRHHYDLVKMDTSRDADAELDHFALRSHPEGPISTLVEQTPKGSELVRYHSLFELKEQWKRFDCRDTASRLIVVLMLYAGFRDSLPGLVRRKYPGQRLLISSMTGRWPGLVSLGDLALHSASLGWQEIGFHRRPTDAISEAMDSRPFAERCIFFYPEEMELFGTGSHSQAALDWESRWM